MQRIQYEKENGNVVSPRRYKPQKRGGHRRFRPIIEDEDSEQLPIPGDSLAHGSGETPKNFKNWPMLNQSDPLAVPEPAHSFLQFSLTFGLQALSAAEQHPIE